MPPSPHDDHLKEVSSGPHAGSFAVSDLSRPGVYGNAGIVTNSRDATAPLAATASTTWAQGCPRDSPSSSTPTPATSTTTPLSASAPRSDRARQLEPHRQRRPRLSSTRSTTSRQLARLLTDEQRSHHVRTTCIPRPNSQPPPRTPSMTGFPRLPAAIPPPRLLKIAEQYCAECATLHAPGRAGGKLSIMWGSGSRPQRDPRRSGESLTAV